jgi:hypothetical protein
MGQVDTMRAVYAAKSDGELEALYAGREDLTEVAAEALAQVMEQRGLLREWPKDEAVAEASDEDALGADEALVYVFNDAFQAREAIRHLRDAEIEHRMLDWHEVEPERAVSWSGVDLGLVTARGDVARARGILKEKLGLFPGAEVDVTAPEDEAEAMVVLSMFERADALVAAQALGAAGISYLWRDGRDAAAGLPDGETVAIEVAPETLERAGVVLEEAMG